jgi:DNA-binding transcriptional ArsR family regulator
MAKHGRTKKRIIALIKSGNNNLSTISSDLKLAPSTVSKHLQDLEESGLIAQKDDSHIKKWKYYEVREQKTVQEGGMEKQGFVGSRVTIVTAAIFLVLVIAGIAYLYGPSLFPRASSTYVPISITDPPQVPAGTQALYINYSSLKVQVGQYGGSVWIPLNASGRLELLGLVNASQVIGGVSVGPNSRVESVAFNIVSASITIDNVSYPVNPQSNQVVAKLNYNGSVNTSSNILLDFSPVIVPLSTNNSASFVMLPSIRGAVVRRMGQDATAGAHSDGPKPLDPGSMRVFAQPKANISIHNASLGLKGSNFSVDLTLRNNEANVITVMGITIVSRNSILPAGEAPFGMGSTDAPNYTSYGRMMGERPDGDDMPAMPMVQRQKQEESQSGWYRQENSSVMINASAVYGTWRGSGNGSVHIHLQKPVNDIYIGTTGSAFNSTHLPQMMPFAFDALNFMVESNGTLTMRPDFRTAQMGYSLGPGTSIGFHYEGAIQSQQDGLLNNTDYTLVVMTDRGPVTVNIK